MSKKQQRQRGKIQKRKKETGMDIRERALHKKRPRDKSPRRESGIRLNNIRRIYVGYVTR